MLFHILSPNASLQILKSQIFTTFLWGNHLNNTKVNNSFLNILLKFLEIASCGPAQQPNLQGLRAS